MPARLSLLSCVLLVVPVAGRAADPAQSAVIERLSKIDIEVVATKNGQVAAIVVGCQSDFRDDDLILLRVFPHLESLTIISAEDVSDAGIAHLKPLKIKKLFVVSEKMTAKSAEHLAAMTDLELLQIRNAPVDGEWLGHLKKLPNLNTLRIRGGSVRDTDAKHFAEFKKLTTVHVWNDGMTDAGLDAIRAALPKATVTR